jgi:hypothetical protein
MATNRSGHRPGGGIASNKVVHRTGPKVEPRSKGVNPGGAGQLGQAQGNHITDRRNPSNYRGEPLYGGGAYNPPVGPTNNLVSGPGGGREVMRSGSQGTHGSPARGNPPPAGELFPGWGAKR